MEFFTPAEIKKIRSKSLLAEQTAKIPADWLKLIYQKKYFKLFIPEKDNGLMMPLPMALRLFDEAGYIDGNLGWALSIGPGGGFFYAYLQPDIATKVFKGSKSVIAGSGAPTGVAKKVKGGYIVNGRWKYCSGSSYGTSFTANVVIDEKTKKYKAFVLEPKQIAIHKDWDAFGMCATESHSMSAKDAFVPEAMTFDLGSELYYKHPIFQYPFLQFAESTFAALTLGLCRHFFEEAHTLIEENKTWAFRPGRETFVKKLVKGKEEELKKASAYFYKLADAAWREMLSKGKLSEKTQKEVSVTAKKTARIVMDSMDSLIPYMGMKAIMRESTINRIWRDTHTTCQHILLVPFE